MKHKLKLTLSTFVILFTCIHLSAQTKVQSTDSGFVLLRNGSPYYVKGVGGEVNFDKMISIGANSFRTWGVENAQKVLDEAQKRGLTVMLGLWLQHERHGFDYDNKEKVKSQLEYFKNVIKQFKDHPALLMWGVGNELDLDYTNPNCWYAVQDIAQYIHQIDPNHPTSTVTAGLDSLEVQYIKSRCPDIDIYSINTYGNIAGVPQNIARYGWSGPYMITEWGPNGHWESPQTKWGVSIEQTSTEKTASYLTRYKEYIDPNKNYCLGSYAFLWGAKQEYTETWYGLFSKDNLPTEPIDAIEFVFTGNMPKNPAPSVMAMQVDGKDAFSSINIKGGEKYPASIKILLSDSLSNDNVSFVWRIFEESTDKKSGGDVEAEATELTGLIIKGSNKSEILFRAPIQAGSYRIFVTVIHNGKVAYANIPFKVVAREDGEKQSRFIQLKYTDMKEFEK
jgi:hypothetical protein